MDDVILKRIKSAHEYLDNLENNVAPTVPQYGLSTPYKVMRFYTDDVLDGNYYVTIDLGSYMDNIWFGMDFAVSASVITYLIERGVAWDMMYGWHDSNDPFDIWLMDFYLDEVGVSFDLPGTYNSDYLGISTDGPLSADTWYHVDYYNGWNGSDYTPAFYVDGVNQNISPRPTEAHVSHSINLIAVGMDGCGFTGISSIVHIKNVTVGTTRTGYDIFDARVLTNSIWPPFDATWGDGTSDQLTLVDDPF